MAAECTRIRETALKAVSAKVAALHKHADGVQNQNVEAVHDMRVASRRLRAALKEFSNSFKGGPRKKMLRTARRITRTLGQPRELDVTSSILGDWSGHVPSVAEEESQKLSSWLLQKRHALADAVQETGRYVSSEELKESAARLLASYKPSEECHIRHGADSLREQTKELRGLYRAWIKTNKEEDLHRLRIQFKKLRYAAEIYDTIYQNGGLDSFIDTLKRAQRALGHWNDQRVLRCYVELYQRTEAAGRTTGLNNFCTVIEDEMSVYLADFDTLALNFFESGEQKNTKQLIKNPSLACCL